MAEVEPVAGQQVADGPAKEGEEVKEAEKKAEERAPKVDDAKTDVAEVDVGNADAVVDTAKDKKTDEVDKPKVDTQGEVAKEAQVKADTKVEGVTKEEGVTKDDAKVEEKKEAPSLIDGVQPVPTSDLINLKLPILPVPEQSTKAPKFSNNPYLHNRPPARGLQSSDPTPTSPAASLVDTFSSLWGGSSSSNSNSSTSNGYSWSIGNSNSF